MAHLHVGLRKLWAMQTLWKADSSQDGKEAFQRSIFNNYSGNSWRTLMSISTSIKAHKEIVELADKM